MISAQPLSFTFLLIKTGLMFPGPLGSNCLSTFIILSVISSKLISDTSTTYLKLKFEAKNASKKERKTFYTYHSPSLAQLVYHTNKVSQNFYAETLLRLISIADGNYGSTAGGVNGVINYFKQKKVDLHGFFMVDGSLFEVQNLISFLVVSAIIITNVCSKAIYKCKISCF